MKHRLTIVLSGILLTACATPNLKPNLTASSKAIEKETFKFAADTNDVFVPDWWKQFNDPILINLVEKALNENRQLDAAQNNLETAYLLTKSARLSKSYSISSNGTGEYGRSIGSSNFDVSFAGNTSASWELDAFGRIKSEINAADYNLEAALQIQRDVAVLIASTTAQAYVNLRSAQEGLQVAQKNTDLQYESLLLVQELAANGRSSDLDVNRSENLYRTTKASLPTFKAAISTSATQLAALTISSTDEILSTIGSSDSSKKIPRHKTGIASGSPRQLINRRPDIRQAEANVSRLLALGDAARARLYPTITFNANIDALFNGSNVLSQFGNVGYGIGPTLSWAGLDLRSGRLNIDISDAETKAALNQYEQIIFDALSDVEGALARYAQELNRRDDLEMAVNSAALALELAQLRFDEGFDDFLDVLDAQRTLLAADEQLVQHETLLATYAISTYRSLGGMWSDEELGVDQSSLTNIYANKKEAHRVL